MGARRREPSISRNDRDESGDALRVGPDDRITGGRKTSSRDHIEPKLTAARRGREDEDMPMARGRGRNDPDDSYDEDDERPRRRLARKKAPRRSLLGGMVYWLCVCGVWALVAVGCVIAYHAAQLPPIDKLAVPKRPPNIAIMGDDGRQLANRGDTGGAAISLRELPAYVPKAFIAIEDRRFYHHWGIDPVGVTRALVRNATGRGAMQGGSTLTQQLAKNLFLTQERTMSRKVQEAILAFWLERKYSKDQILELYLNRVYFGSGAYGVEAAARKYFGHGARETTLPEAAMLAGLMKAPTKLAPNRNLVAATDRASTVITAMAQEGMITDRMAALAIMQPARVSRETAGSINYAADYVMDVLNETVGAIDEDIVVSTTLSADKQAAAEKALTDELDKSGKRFGVAQGALVSMDPNGQIKALVGGRNYAESQFNRAVSARRQPGSSFKPFIYLTALERGLTPDTIRDDAPINVRGWQPENSSQDYQGRVTLTRALAMSLNTVAVRLGLEVGPKAVVATAHRLGVASDLQANASIALGTSEVTPLELVSAYAPFANGGIRVQPNIITRVRTAKGKLLYQRKGASFGRVIEPSHVGMMNTMLQETLIIGTAKHAELPGWQAAGKTGTSQDYRDAWFVGYTSQLVTGVWLGNDDNSPTRKTSGGNLPVNIWSKYMRTALLGVAPTPLPGVLRGVDPGFGLPPGDIGGTGPQARRDPIGDMIQPARERNFFERLFGG
jgi:penicillin-binding protein 1A